MIIGLTGGIGSGKSTVAQFFRELGVLVIDADQITRQLVQPNQPALKKIVAYFGSHILQDDKTLDRKKLRNIIFEDPNARLWLENLLHPLVKQKIVHTPVSSSIPYIIVEVPLLIEAHFHDVVDRILVIDSPESLQIQRVVQRDNIDAKEIQAIINTQATRATRLAEADDVIFNEGTVEELKKQVEVYHEKVSDLDIRH